MKRFASCFFLALFFAMAINATCFAQKSLEKLLKDSKLDYMKAEGGWYKVWVSYQGESTLIMAAEKTLGSDESDSKLKICYLFCVVLPAREDGTPPPAYFKKISELNESLTMGRVGFGNKDGITYYMSSFWLSTTNVEVLGQELALAHFTRLSLKKTLEGF